MKDNGNSYLWRIYDSNPNKWGVATSTRYGNFIQLLHNRRDEENKQGIISIEPDLFPWLPQEIRLKELIVAARMAGCPVLPKLINEKRDEREVMAGYLWRIELYQYVDTHLQGRGRICDQWEARGWSQAPVHNNGNRRLEYGKEFARPNLEQYLGYNIYGPLEKPEVALPANLWRYLSRSALGLKIGDVEIPPYQAILLTDLNEAIASANTIEDITVNMVATAISLLKERGLSNEQVASIIYRGITPFTTLVEYGDLRTSNEIYAKVLNRVLHHSFEIYEICGRRSRQEAVKLEVPYYKHAIAGR